MRFLAIDYGQKRTGLATGDDVTTVVTPLEVITAATDESRLAAIARVIDDHGPGALVLGLPLNMDDSEGPAAVAARAFADQLHQRFQLPVHLVDERLTSFDADHRLRDRDLTRGQKKQRHDALAAAAILEDFFRQQATG